jgi:hypothetical protein
MGFPMAPYGERQLLGELGLTCLAPLRLGSELMRQALANHLLAIS